jgi:hypothetical protein
MPKTKFPFKARLALQQDATEIQGMRPEYLRIPAASRVSGLSRTHLFEAMAEGQVKYVHIRRPGKSKGVRLIQTASLMAYLASFETPAREQVGA